MTAPDPRRALALGPRSAPLSLLRSAIPAPESCADARCIALEFSSRGDRVPGRILMPSRDGPHPLVILEPGDGGALCSPDLCGGADWVGAGIAVASIDLPLHGRRASPKLSERLQALLAREGERTPVLLEEFARQALHDLARLVDAASGLPEIDPKRIAYAGLGLGATFGAIFCALDPRPRAVALAPADGGRAPDPLDPARYIGAVAPRPLLVIEAGDDSGAGALLAAAGEPRTHQRIDVGRERLLGPGLEAMRAFLTPHLTS